jgi:hypothetical protein
MKARGKWPAGLKQEHLDAWAASGLSGYEYAKQAGISPGDLYAWRNRMKAQSAIKGMPRGSGISIRLANGASFDAPADASLDVIMALIKALQDPA